MCNNHTDSRSKVGKEIWQRTQCLLREANADSWALHHGTAQLHHASACKLTGRRTFAAEAGLLIVNMELTQRRPTTLHFGLYHACRVSTDTVDALCSIINSQRIFKIPPLAHCMKNLRYNNHQRFHHSQNVSLRHYLAKYKLSKIA